MAVILSFTPHWPTLTPWCADLVSALVQDSMLSVRKWKNWNHGNPYIWKMVPRVWRIRGGFTTRQAEGVWGFFFHWTSVTCLRCCYRYCSYYLLIDFLTDQVSHCEMVCDLNLIWSVCVDTDDQCEWALNASQHSVNPLTLISVSLAAKLDTWNHAI